MPCSATVYIQVVLGRPAYGGFGRETYLVKLGTNLFISKGLQMFLFVFHLDILCFLNNLFSGAIGSIITKLTGHETSTQPCGVYLAVLLNTYSHSAGIESLKKSFRI